MFNEKSAKPNKETQASASAPKDVESSVHMVKLEQIIFLTKMVEDRYFKKLLKRNKASTCPQNKIQESIFIKLSPSTSGVTYVLILEVTTPP
ncbi:hypothetical protein V6N13_074613 [Hibiscus sabdariffa]